MPCPTCPISFRTCKKKKNLHFQSQWFDYEKGIGFTVWTKIRLRPSKAFWGTREKGCLLPRSLGARPLNFEKLHDFPASVYGLLMEGGRALPRAPKLHMNITVPFNSFS